MHIIALMNERLNQLNQVFSQTTNHFVHSINLHQANFTTNDFEDFEMLMTEIKRQVKLKIQKFFEEKHLEHSHKYQHKIANYTQNSQDLQSQLLNFRAQLQQQTLSLKEQEQRNQLILDHFSRKFYLNTLRKKYLSGFKKNLQISRKQAHVNSQATRMYRKNLIKKVFFPWRSLTYKEGHENTVHQQTQQDIQNIHSQYSSIISILKQKIRDTQELTKVKKAAKNEFSYALSKNLMKTISNLSLQVMSLNQVSLKDEECSINSEHDRFMREVDKIVDQKFRKVNEYKQNLMADAPQRGERQKKIRFV